MSNYVMTPARRAALRRAQLISARKRRKHSVAGYAFHDVRQRAGIAYNEGRLKHYKSAPQRELAGKKVKALPGKAAKKGTRYVVKRAAIGTAKAGITLGAATAIGYTAYGMTSHAQIGRQRKAYNSHLKSMGYGKTTRVASSRVYGKKIKALPRGRS